MNDGWSQTYTGRKVYPLELKPEHIFIEDIAWQLSGVMRYSAACKFDYSVAQHSLLISQKMREDNFSKTSCLCGLMHDSHEIYPPGDISSVLKMQYPDHPYIVAARELEISNEKIVRRTFGLPGPESDVWCNVKKYDTRIVVDERLQVMHEMQYPVSDVNWGIPRNTHPLRVVIEERSREDVADDFLQTFYDLYT